MLGYFWKIPQIQPPADMGGVPEGKLLQEVPKVLDPGLAGFSVDDEGKRIEGYFDGIEAVLLERG